MTNPYEDGEDLTGLYKHACWEWDGLVIDETCDEFACCYCYADARIAQKEIEAFKAAARDRIHAATKEAEGGNQ